MGIREIFTDSQFAAAIAVSPFLALALVGLALESLKIFETISEERAQKARVRADVPKWDVRR
jgi:hypothetical protein